tara:strand:- start:11934 stop:13199 length:1266 start_codon:yes stop_codon:yes gene_type:complete
MRKCKNWLRTYAEYTSASEAPAQMHFWTGVSVLAGALQRRVWLDQRFFQWTPNFYIILVGPPGIVGKSTTLRLGHLLLNYVDGINFGPDSMTWQGLSQAMAEAKVLVPIEGTSDFIPMSCVTCSVSELGTFLRPEDKRMIDVLTDLWDGQQVTWKHKVRTSEDILIENPWLNIAGCTTPAWLRDNLSAIAIEGGLLRRVLFVFGSEKRQLTPYPAEVVIRDDFKQIEENLAHDLAWIAQLFGEYSLNKEALAWGNQWYSDLWNKRPPHLADERLGGYIATKQTHIHKLAMVLAAAQRDELVITKEDLSLANQFVTGLEHDMQIVLATIGAAPTSRHMAEMIEHIKKAGGKLNQRKLWQVCLRNMMPKEFAEASDAAVKAGYLRIIQNGQEINYHTTDEEVTPRPQTQPGEQSAEELLRSQE